MIIKHFEISTGINRGFYILIDSEIESKEYKVLRGYGWGLLGFDNGYYNFLKKHGVDDKAYFCFTHSKFGGHELNRKVYLELVELLEGINEDRFIDKLKPFLVPIVARGELY